MREVEAANQLEPRGTRGMLRAKNAVAKKRREGDELALGMWENKRRRGRGERRPLARASVLGRRLQEY